MIVVTVEPVQADHANDTVPAWARTPAFVERWRSALVSSPVFARTSAAPTWFGLVIVGMGFAVIAFGWGRVGGLSAVALQIPYLVSAGCGGLGLIVLGVTIVGVQAKRREAAAREDTILELGRVVRELERIAESREARR